MANEKPLKKEDLVVLMYAPNPRYLTVQNLSDVPNVSANLEARTWSIIYPKNGME